MKTLIATSALALMFAASPVYAQGQTASATYIDAEGQEIGEATLAHTPNGVVVEIDVEGLPAEQWVAVHVHENGECDPEGGFDSAGGHFNPAEVDHGYYSETGPHAGDMPNQYVGADGILRSHLFNPFATLGQGDADIMGRALMIHGGADDYESQPSGDAGDRIACAVIE
tara:strand:- start:2539 stop:3048 length:510 start_codon:yes stop_codon:yes gene_type:complete